MSIEIAEGMSLEADFVSHRIANALGAKTSAGIIDICPANASLLIRFNPAPRGLSPRADTPALTIGHGGWGLLSV